MQEMGKPCSGGCSCCDECRRNISRVMAMMDQSEESLKRMMTEAAETDRVSQEIDRELQRHRQLMDRRQAALDARQESLTRLEDHIAATLFHLLAAMRS